MLTWLSPAPTELSWAAVGEPLPGLTTVALPPSEKLLIPPVRNATDVVTPASRHTAVMAENTATATATDRPLRLPGTPSDIVLSPWPPLDLAPIEADVDVRWVPGRVS